MQPFMAYNSFQLIIKKGKINLYIFTLQQPKQCHVPATNSTSQSQTPGSNTLFVLVKPFQFMCLFQTSKELLMDRLKTFERVRSQKGKSTEANAKVLCKAL